MGPDLPIPSRSLEQRHRARRRLRPHPRRLGFLAGSGTTPSPTPTIPTINVIDDDDNTVTIVARGEDYSDSNFVTVIDTDGKRYLIRYGDNGQGLCNDGTSNDELFYPDELDGCITAAIYNGVTPPNNWLILEWLHENYALSLDMNSLFISTGNDGAWAYGCSVACENGLQTIGGTISGRATKGVIFDDGIIGPDDNKFIDCQGKQISAEPEIRIALETISLAVLAEEETTESARSNAFTTLILQVNRIIDYPLQVITP